MTTQPLQARSGLALLTTRLGVVLFVIAIIPFLGALGVLNWLQGRTDAVAPWVRPGFYALCALSILTPLVLGLSSPLLARCTRKAWTSFVVTLVFFCTVAAIGFAATTLGLVSPLTDTRVLQRLGTSTPAPARPRPRPPAPTTDPTPDPTPESTPQTTPQTTPETTPESTPAPAPSPEPAPTPEPAPKL